MDRRQVILIMTDSQRLDMVSCYEDVGIKTPCLDAMARQGLRFANAYTVQPVCGPARSALFTGQYPCINGAFANCNAPALNVKTIGQRLRDQGVLTAYIGKWHLDGGDYFGLGRAPDGWDADTWYDMRNYLEELSDEERLFTRQNPVPGQTDVPSSLTFAHRCADRAVRFIEEHKDTDFFLVVSFDEPHGPSLCPQPYLDMYKDYTLPKRPNVYDTLEGKPSHQKVWSGDARFQDRESIQLKAPAFFGCNSYVDSQIGRVTAACEENLRRPVVFYTSDHGEMLQSHCLTAKGPAAYEEICHVPLIVTGLGQGVVETPVSHIDIPATIWDHFGQPKPFMMQGESLLGLCEGERPKNRDIFIEFGRYETDHDGFGGFQPMRCIYDGRYKLVLNLLSEDELYDLRQDPYEMDNRITDPATAPVRDALHQRLLQHMNEIRDPFRGYVWQARSWSTSSFTPTWAYTGYTRQREEPAYEPVQLDYATGLPITELTRMKHPAAAHKPKNG